MDGSSLPLLPFAFCVLPVNPLQENVPLAPLTTFQVGGPARYFLEARTEENVREAVDLARSRNWPLFVLGGGSNLVVSDAGWPGLVLRIAILGIEERHERGKVWFHAGAGEDWDAFVAHCVARNCAGVECMSGIPGTVGGTPIQNVGAYGQETGDIIAQVRVLDLDTGSVRDLDRAECGFQYRTSIFNTSGRGRHIVLGVTYALEAGCPARVEYADLKKHFAGRNGPPTLAETREAVRAIRLSKAMLLVPGDADCRSAGSFFKNPILTPEKFKELVEAHPEVPRWPAGEGREKIAGAWLVEQSGFHKGWSRGPVGISTRHALAIVNRGGARAADIVALKDEIQKRVFDQFGIGLEPEPVFVGF